MLETASKMHTKKRTAERILGLIFYFSPFPFTKIHPHSHTQNTPQLFLYYTEEFFNKLNKDGTVPTSREDQQESKQVIHFSKSTKKKKKKHLKCIIICIKCRCFKIRRRRTQKRRRLKKSMIFHGLVL